MNENTPHTARPECIEKMLKLENESILLKRDVTDINMELIDLHKKIETINEEKIEKSKEEIQIYKQRFFWLLTSIISIVGGGIGIFIREFLQNILK